MAQNKSNESARKPFSKIRNNRVFQAITRSDEFSVFLPLLFIVVITTIFRPDFLSARNFSSMFTEIPFVAITALGVSFVLMTGAVDISTGRCAGLGGIMMSMLIVEHNWGVLPAILVAFACCAMVGVVNGILVVKLGMNDFIATMGTMYVVHGLRHIVIHNPELSMNNLTDPGTVAFVNFFKRRILGMYPSFWIMIILFAIVFVVIKRTLWGRRLLACGDNREVAKLAGINVTRMRMLAYIICSVFCCIGGLLQTLDMKLGRPETGDGWEFRAIAGCVVGGVSLSGGKGSPLGVLIGVTLVFVAESAIIFLGLPDTLRVSVKGAVMAAAVLFDIYRQSKKVAE